MKVSKRFADRATPALRRYQKLFESARTRDVNESDTSVMVSDFLADVLGYNKYEDITTEFAIKSQFCDLAIKRNGRIQYLIEVKSAGTDLRENHLNQAIAYGAREGIEWVILTNGAEWQAHRLGFGQPVTNDLVFSIDLLDAELRRPQLLEKLYLISKEAGDGSIIDRYHRHKEATSRYVLAQLLLDGPVLSTLRRQIRTLYPGLKVTTDRIAELLRDEVVKRDALEGEKAAAGERQVRRAGRKRQKAKASAPEAAAAAILTVPEQVPPQE